VVLKAESAQEASEMLMKKSLERGTTDNVSVMIIKFQTEPTSNTINSDDSQGSQDQPIEGKEASDVSEPEYTDSLAADV